MLDESVLPDPWEVQIQTEGTDDDESVYRASGLVDESRRTDHGKRHIVVTKWDNYEWFVLVWDPVGESELHQLSTEFRHRDEAEVAALGLLTQRTESTGSEPYPENQEDPA